MLLASFRDSFARHANQRDLSFFALGARRWQYPHMEKEFLDRARANGLVIAYTDGACEPNPGFGGWAYILTAGQRRLEAYGGLAGTTSNRMELIAVLEALKAVPDAIPLRIFSDSQYVINAATIWMPKWESRGWRLKTRRSFYSGKSGLTPVKNSDLMRAIRAHIKRRRIEWVWLKGHNGHYFNERADLLAARGRWTNRDSPTPLRDENKSAPDPLIQNPKLL